MAAVIDATVGGASANSYLTVAEADAYMETHPLFSNWDGATAQEQINALIEGTRLLDDYFSWIGDIASDTQALRWPRTNAEDPDGRAVASDIIPDPVKRATAVMGTETLLSSVQAARDDEGIHSVSVAGAVSVVFD